MPVWELIRINSMNFSDLEPMVIDQIAFDHELDPATLYVGENGGIFYSQDGVLQCLCQKGSEYWCTLLAGIAADILISRCRA